MQATAHKKQLILRLLEQHRILTIATMRPDGWPQATLVGYVNDGFLLYCFVSRNSQKYQNIKADPRVSIAIGSDAPHPSDLKGLSLAARCIEVTDQEEISHVAALRLRRYPEYAELPPPILQGGDLQRLSVEPDPRKVAILRIEPEIISVLDYSKQFGHSDLVAFSGRDLDVHVKSQLHQW